MKGLERKPLDHYLALGFDRVVAECFARYGRCLACGWFGGHCPDTRTSQTTLFE